jgi:hypothetical protein
MKKTLLFSLQMIVYSLFSQNNVNPRVLNLNHISDNKSAGYDAIYQKARMARVVFTGENHTQVEFNARTEYTLMRSLYEHCGYRNFIIEMSPVRAHYMERYISHNDTHARDLLKSIASDKFLRLFDHLHAWMKNVPQNERIHIHGLDVERFYDMSFYRMNDALKKQKTVPNRQIYILAKQIIPQIVANNYNAGMGDYSTPLEIGNKSLMGDETSYSDFEITEVVDSISAYIELFKKWLSPADFEIFNEGYRGAVEFKKWTNLENRAQQYLWREERMFQNFLSILTADTTQKFFGQFGRCHSALSKQWGDCGWYNFKSISNKVKTRYFKGDSTKIVSIAIMYKDNEENLSAVDHEQNYTIEQEINLIKNSKSKSPLLFDLSDSTMEFTELRKKFNFALLNSENVLELPNLDTNAMWDVAEPYEPYSDGFFSWVNRTDFNFNWFGYSYGNPNVSAMANHLNSLNTNISGIPKWFVNHHVEFNRNWFLCQANLFYNMNAAEIYSDSAKKLNYNVFGATLGIGVRALSLRKFKLDLFGLGGYYYQSIENYPESADILNASTKRVKIESQSMVYGGQIQLIYNFSKYVGIGAKYQILYRSNDEKWNFNESHLEYQNFGKSPKSVFSDFGIFVNFRSTIYH